MTFGHYSKSAAGLAMLEAHAASETYRRALDSLSGGIQEVSKYLEGLPEDKDHDWRDLVIDDECDVVENLLGAAFVVCQTKITAVSQTAVWLKKAVKEEGGNLAAFGATKDAVMAFGAPQAGLGGLTQVQAIWAIANYFKHRDEWDTAWDKLKKPSAETASRIMSIGLARGCTGNLRRGAEALGNHDYGKLSLFAEHVDYWAALVVDTCERVVRA